jgi:DedD protein
MRRAFDDEEEFEQQNSSADTELTLGIGTLLLLGVGLIVLCGICFGLGYMTGRGKSAPQEAQQATAPAGLQTGGSQQKPSAIEQTPAPAPPQTTQQVDSAPQTPVAQAQPNTAVAAPVIAGQNSTPPQAQPQAQQQVRPALPVTPVASQPVQTQPPLRTANAASSQSLWVQIAAVSHLEDAQVLTTALTKRGYGVTMRRETDNLIHVRIGPFNSRDEANQWRKRLLDDGYNAEVQQ